MRKIFKFGLIVVRENKLLLCKPFAFPDLITPGGIKENGEDYITNLLRETREELGEKSQLDVASLEYIGKFEDFAAGRTDVIVEIDLYKGKLDGELIASSEISELVWYEKNNENHVLSPIVIDKIIPHLISQKILIW